MTPDPPVCVLIIDDTPDVRHMLTETVRNAGYIVHAVADGKRALAAFEQIAPDIVISDIIMPEGEGLETIQALHRQRPEMPIIAISGGGLVGPDSYLRCARHMGADRAFTKPLDTPMLLEAIRELTRTVPDHADRCRPVS